MLLNLVIAAWPWYVAGPLIGLMVPLLLIMGNKTFGISSSLRHVCAACMPAKIPFFKYNWRKESWNLVFAAGIIAGGAIASNFLSPSSIDPNLVAELNSYNVNNHSGLLPDELFNWSSLLSLKGIIVMAVGGFLVGFGTRYAGGC